MKNRKKYLFLFLIPLLFLTLPLNYFSSFNTTSSNSNIASDDYVPASVITASLDINDVTTTENSVTIRYTSVIDQQLSYGWTLTSIELKDADGSVLETNPYTSSTISVQGSITHVFSDSESHDGTYVNWKLTGNYKYSSDESTDQITETIHPFSLISVPNFTSQTLNIDRKNNVGYVDYYLDLGSDSNTRPYKLNDNVKVIYDGSEVAGVATDDSTEGTIKIKDINSYEYFDGFVLVADTTYDSGAVTQKVDSPSFSESTGKFSDDISSKYSVHEDKLTISYQIYMGNGTDGKYYQLNSDGVTLVNANNEVLASDENPSSVNDYGFVSGEIVIDKYSHVYNDIVDDELKLMASTSETEEDNNVTSKTLDSTLIIDPEAAINVWLIVVIVSAFLILIVLLALLLLIKKLNAKRSAKMNKTLNG